MIRSFVLAAVAALGSAQLRQRDALITWWANGDCQGDPRTHVIAVQGFAQVVPNAREFSTYRVSCANDGSGRAILQYCTDRNGANCPVQTNVAPGQCVANNRDRFGNAGVTVVCPAPGAGDILIPEAFDLRPGHVDINWFQQPGCGQTQFDRTIVIAQTGIAHLVPVARSGESNDVQEAYRVFCNDDGSGIYQTCTDRNCANVRTTATFRNDGDCIPNPPEFGSSSVAFRCAGQPPPPLVPFQAAGGSAACAGSD